jgi:hypothetical protein
MAVVSGLSLDDWTITLAGPSLYIDSCLSGGCEDKDPGGSTSLNLMGPTVPQATAATGPQPQPQLRPQLLLVAR